MKHIYLITLSICVLTACPDNPTPPEVTTIDQSVYADELGEAARWSTDEQKQTYDRGREVLMHRFTVEDGLGPHFNVSFCGSCHEQPVFGGSSPRYRDFLLVASEQSDGSVIEVGVNGVQPQFQIDAPHRFPTDPATNLTARRNAIPFFGAGAIARLDESAILANVDPDDADGDGISGRANYDRGFVGRFGRKAQTVSLEGFIRGPLFNHLGITSDPLPQFRKAALPVSSALVDSDGAVLRANALNCLTCQAAAPDEPNADDDGVPDPELSEDDLFALVSFTMLIGAPEPDVPTTETKAGAETFEKINCTGCHVPGLKGPDGIVMAYSDFLLHDMGEELADGFSQGLASGSEYKTPPLWGVAAVAPYLHDGRADTLDEAIRMHAGEAKKSREAYDALSDKERSELLAFLNSLGAASAKSEGLIPPGDLTTPGELGGAVSGLTTTDQETFERGRRMFDKDFKTTTGLGTQFNGDSCRACHFDGAVGGGGPIGVNVIREGGTDDQGTFVVPSHGTLLHRFDVTGERSEPDAGSSIFEMRQTPPMFGLGKIDDITEAEILANVPTNPTPNAIAGVARIMDDGRVGRFGWKAGLPTLEDFVRDAISNEVGLTIAADSEFIAGFSDDDDDVQDPELAQDDYSDLVFFAKKLAAPPRGEITADVTAGEMIFSNVGCDSCHIPSLKTASGEDVWLYSDLLLHDVQKDTQQGVYDGDISGRLYRTPPLWGLRWSAPYMHSGLAGTIDAAIKAHDGTSTEVVSAYDDLSDSERQQLLAFLESL